MDNHKSKPSIVIDSGSGYIKAGFNDEKVPKVVFPTIVGYPQNSHDTPEKNKNYYIGADIEAKIEELYISYPIGYDAIKYWDDMERIYEHVFTKELKADLKEHKVMITETTLNPKIKEKITKYMFETFNIPGLYVTNPSMLSLYASGKVTGIIVELGERFSHFMPFFVGYSLPSSDINQNFGGNDLTEYMVRALQEEGYNLGNKSSKLIANKIKEKACYVSLDYEKELKSVEPFDYELPDGKHVIIKSSRLTCPEILFRPDAFGIIGKDNIGELCVIIQFKNVIMILEKIYIIVLFYLVVLLCLMD